MWARVRWAVAAAVVAGLGASPTAGLASTAALSVDTHRPTIGENVLVTFKGSNDRMQNGGPAPTRIALYRADRAAVCPPTPPTDFDDVLIDHRLIPHGAFERQLTITHATAAEVTLCGYVAEGLNRYAVASARVTFVLPAPWIDPLEPLAGRSGSIVEGTVTGFAQPGNIVYVHVRRGQTPCGFELEHERAFEGTAEIVRHIAPTQGRFSLPAAWHANRGGLHRVCVYIVHIAGRAQLARAEGTALVDDGLPPDVAATPSYATAGRRSVLRFALDDDTGPTGATVTVHRGDARIARIAVPRSAATGPRTATWRPPAGLHASLRFCVAARDGAGHTRTACSTVLVRPHWPCGEPTPARRAGRCDTPASVRRGGDRAGFVDCGAGLTARWTTCATARGVYARRRAPTGGWTCSAAWRQCVAPLPRDAYVLWRS